MSTEPTSLLHLCLHQTVLELRRDIFEREGYRVVTVSALDDLLPSFSRQTFDLVLIDVEGGEDHIRRAEKLCEEVRKQNPGQKIAFICNYRVALDSSCPDGIIHNEFNPRIMLQGVKDALEKS